MTIPDIAERDTRFRRTRDAVQRAGLDALLVAGKGHWWTGRGYFRYFTDFHLWGHDGLLLLPLDGEPVLTLTSPAVADRIARRGWVTDTRGDVYIVPRMADAIRARGLGRARIGIAGLRFILSAGSYAELRRLLPDATFVDADELLDRVRMVKSPLEIRQNYELWEMAKRAMTTFVEILPGARGASQREVSAEVTKQLWAQGARDILIFIGEDPGAYDPPQDIPLRCEDKVRFHLEICGPSGHWCELTVNCAFRPPHDLERRLMEDELLAFDEVRKVARPGSRLSDLAATFNRVLQEQGWALGEPTTHFHFHGQGLDTIERPWFAEAAPWGQSQDWVLEAGVILSYHPHRDVLPSGYWSTGLNEDILITPQGAERLSVDWDNRWRPVGG
ncbi:MAG: aminopeptidase P family N-terminal domain-containing protein [Armatimonadota bacterium]|nr:aminopeptidase P family N-terminal domain-containing protein [Armatimonadota bacterium]MDR7545643.1 aminopeptidase P family N-terminal domain-containing protein [Armatimonadota bacterium]